MGPGSCCTMEEIGDLAMKAVEDAVDLGLGHEHSAEVADDSTELLTASCGTDPLHAIGRRRGDRCVREDRGRQGGGGRGDAGGAAQ